MTIDVLDLLDKLMHDKPGVELAPDWIPEQRGQCVCGHSWLFHWLAGPHKCNDCKECEGYRAVEATKP